MSAEKDQVVALEQQWLDLKEVMKSMAQVHILRHSSVLAAAP